MNARIALAFVFVWALSACATTQQVSDKTYQAPTSDYRLIVMAPDIQVAVLTAGVRPSVAGDVFDGERPTAE